MFYIFLIISLSQDFYDIIINLINLVSNKYVLSVALQPCRRILHCYGHIFLYTILFLGIRSRFCSGFYNLMVNFEQVLYRRKSGSISKFNLSNIFATFLSYITYCNIISLAIFRSA